MYCMQNRRQSLVADDAIECFVSFDLLYLYLHRRIVAAADNSLLAVCWMESQQKLEYKFCTKIGSIQFGTLTSEWHDKSKSQVLLCSCKIFPISCCTLHRSTKVFDNLSDNSLKRLNWNRQKQIIHVRSLPLEESHNIFFFFRTYRLFIAFISDTQFWRFQFELIHILLQW